jgi:hypothetical protein
VVALPTSAALAPVATFTFLSYAGPPLPPGVGPGGVLDPGTAPVRFSKVTDVTQLVVPTPGTPRRHKRTWQQVVTLRNTGGSPLAGPLLLVLGRLGRGTTVRGRAGVTRKHAPLKSPYVVVNLGSDGLLAPGEVLAVVLQFGGARPRYAAHVLAGPGTP